MKYDPTIEDSYIIKVVVNDQQCTLEIIDTAGVDEYSHFRDKWIRANEGFILVYSIFVKTIFYMNPRTIRSDPTNQEVNASSH
jgi:GTPase SAR1 family protein